MKRGFELFKTTSLHSEFGYEKRLNADVAWRRQGTLDIGKLIQDKFYDGSKNKALYLNKFDLKYKEYKYDNGKATVVYIG